MSPLQTVALLAVAVVGTGVVLSRDPVRQTIATGMFGLTLATLFFTLQAPDVALSQIAVGSVALPVMVLLTLAKLRRRAGRRDAGAAAADPPGGSGADREPAG